MGFIGDGFTNSNILTGAMAVIIVLVLLATWQYILAGIAIIIGIVLGLAILGFFGKLIGKIFGGGG